MFPSIRSIFYEDAICVVCGKKYTKRKKDSGRKPLGGEVRGAHCLTCSKKCSKLWVSRGKLRWRAKNKISKSKNNTPNYSQQIKKDNFDSSNENYLETQNFAGEDNKSEQMPVKMENQSADSLK